MIVVPINVVISTKLPIEVTVENGVPISVSFVDRNIITIEKYKTFIDPNETPNGIRVNFTCPSGYIEGTLLVYRSQSTLIRGIDYYEISPNSGTFQLVDAPDSDEDIRVSYISI